MKGKLIVFEGIDGSGKSTQFKMVCDRLKKNGYDFRTLVFPQYNEPSSALIRMYLGGEFGENPDDVNAYAASAFYAVDRYASYVKVWRDYYLGGGIVLADRYTTSNAIHQASKVTYEDRADFFGWLKEFEYTRMGLPEPDIVLYMDISLDNAIRNMRSREEKSGTHGDIHETDNEYLTKCIDAARAAADFYSWDKIQCVRDGNMRSAELIHEDIIKKLDFF